MGPPDAITASILPGTHGMDQQHRHSPTRQIATESQDQSVKLWSLNFDEEPLCTIPDHSNAIVSLEFSPDGQTLAVGTGRLGFGNTITIYTVWQEETRPYKKHGNMPL